MNKTQELDVWNAVRKDSLIKWLGADGILYDAKVVHFSGALQPIGILDDNGPSSIWVEQIKAVKNPENEDYLSFLEVVK